MAKRILSPNLFLGIFLGFSVVEILFPLEGGCQQSNWRLGVIVVMLMMYYHFSTIKKIEEGLKIRAQLEKQLAIAENEKRAAQRAAETDQLTGLLNRRGISRMIQKVINAQRRLIHTAESEAVMTQVAVAFVDLDGFKQVNDTLGHDAGDKVICIAAELLQSYFARGTDILCRPGGDEFIVFSIMEETGSSRTTTVIEHLRHFRQVFAERFQDFAAGEFSEGRGLTVTASCGVIVCRTPNDAGIIAEFIDDMIRSADELMYEAKRGGKNLGLVIRYI